MFPPGHLALGIHLVRRLPGLASGHAATAALLIGTLTPDLIDKTLQWTGVYPWGRTWGHSLVGNLVLAAIAVTFWILAQFSTPAAATPARQGVEHLPTPASGQQVVESTADSDSTRAPAQLSPPPQSQNVDDFHAQAPEAAPGSTRPNTLRTTAALLTCLCVGQWSHLVADIWNDLEQGAMNTGYLWSAWMAWPWMTPDDLPCTIPPWLPGRRWITFSEAFVVILALRVGLGARVTGPGSPATEATEAGRNETGG